MRIIRELSRTGQSPTLQEVIDDLLPALMDLFQVDESRISEAISFQMDEEKMRQMYKNQSVMEESSYRSNLLRFGYADVDDPSMITIYPNNFEAKD